MHTKVFQILIITLVLTSAMTARAGTGDDVATARDLPPRTPWKYPRIMTMLDETSTSDCIGRPVTPLCAVETWLACTLRRDEHLCELVGKGGFGFGLNQEGMYEPMLERYLISRSSIVDDRHFPWPPLSDFGQPKGVPSVQAGDARIDVRSLLCYDGAQKMCWNSYGSAQSYILRKKQGWWRLMASYPIGEWPR